MYLQLLIKMNPFLGSERITPVMYSSAGNRGSSNIEQIKNYLQMLKVHICIFPYNNRVLLLKTGSH